MSSSVRSNGNRSSKNALHAYLVGLSNQVPLSSITDVLSSDNVELLLKSSTEALPAESAVRKLVLGADDRLCVKTLRNELESRRQLEAEDRPTDTAATATADKTPSEKDGDEQHDENKMALLCCASHYEQALTTTADARLLACTEYATTPPHFDTFNAEDVLHSFRYVAVAQCHDSDTKTTRIALHTKKFSKALRGSTMEGDHDLRTFLFLFLSCNCSTDTLLYKTDADETTAWYLGTILGHYVASSCRRQHSDQTSKSVIATLAMTLLPIRDNVVNATILLGMCSILLHAPLLTNKKSLDKASFILHSAFRFSRMSCGWKGVIGSGDANLNWIKTWASNIVNSSSRKKLANGKPLLPVAAVGEENEEADSLSMEDDDEASYDSHKMEEERNSERIDMGNHPCFILDTTPAAVHAEDVASAVSTVSTKTKKGDEFTSLHNAAEDAGLTNQSVVDDCRKNGGTNECEEMNEEESLSLDPNTQNEGQLLRALDAAANFHNKNVNNEIATALDQGMDEDAVEKTSGCSNSNDFDVKGGEEGPSNGNPPDEADMSPASKSLVNLRENPDTKNALNSNDRKRIREEMLKVTESSKKALKPTTASKECLTGTESGKSALTPKKARSKGRKAILGTVPELEPLQRKEETDATSPSFKEPPTKQSLVDTTPHKSTLLVTPTFADSADDAYTGRVTRARSRTGSVASADSSQSESVLGTPLRRSQRKSDASSSSLPIVDADGIDVNVPTLLSVPKRRSKAFRPE